MRTYFKGSSGLFNKPPFPKPKQRKETDKRNKEARSGSMRTANSLNTIQNKRFNTTLWNKINEKVGLWERGLAGGERAERWEGDKQK
jgi:hypothetical protein